MTGLRYRDYCAMEPLNRIALVKTGVPTELLGQLATNLGISRSQLCRWLGLPPGSVARKARQGRPLGPLEGEPLLGLARLVGEVEQIILESADQLDFDAARWLSQWLVQPNFQLGGQRPVEYIGTADGRSLLTMVLRRMQSCVCL